MAPQTAASLQTGDLINQRFRVVSLLGRGGMGFVYLVQDTLHDDKQLALKTLRIERLNESLMELFKGEFRILTQLQHPNIARVEDFGFTSGARGQAGSEGVFFTSEYIPGVDLFKATTAAPLKDLYGITVQICRALEYIGSRAIVHGDLKPANILVHSNRVKIVDFGIATEFFKKQTGSLFGTPKYMAPELIRGDQADTRADLYALGVILYLLVTRQFPFEGRTPEQIFSRHLEEPPLPPRRIRKDLPPEFEKIILRLLEKDPGDRFFRANQIIEEINRFSEKPFAFETKETQEGYILSGKFVGRSREMNRLRDFHRDLFAPNSTSSNLLVVSGERGGGKTRMIREYKNYLQLNHLPVFIANRSGRSDRAFGTFSSLVQQIIGHCPSSVLEKYRKPLSPLAPFLGEGQSVETDASHSPEFETFRLYEFVSQFLIEATHFLGPKEQPGYAIFMDNIEDTDRESLELFHFLFHSINQLKPRVPLLLVATRTEMSASLMIHDLPEEFDGDTMVLTGTNEASSGFSAKRFFQNLIDANQVHLVELAPLSLRDIQELVRSMTGSDLGGPGFAPQLEKITKGNPLFIQEVMRAVLKPERIPRSDDIRPEFREIDLQNLRIPKSVEDIIKERCQGLSKDERAMLEILAVINAPVSAETLLKVYHREQPDQEPRALNDVFHTLTALKNRGDIQMDLDEGLVRYRIAQDYLQKIVYERIPAVTCKRLHLGYARQIEEVASAEPRNIEILAHHYIRGGEPQKAISYALQAALRCKETYAYRAAVDFYDAALALVQRHAATDVERIEEIHKEIAYLCRYLGELGRSVQSLQSLIQILENVGAPAARLISIYRQLGEMFQLLGKPDEAMQALETASGFLAEISDPREQLKILWIRGRVLYRKADFQRMAEEAEKGLALAKDNRFREERAELLCNRGLARLYRDDFENAVGDFKTALSILEEDHHLAQSTYPINCLGVVRSKQGRIDEAIDYFKRAYEVAKLVGDSRHLINFALNIGTTYHLRHEYRMANEYYERALAVGERIHHPTETAKILTNLGLLHIECLHLEKGEEIIRRALALARQQQFREFEIYNLIFLADIFREREDWTAVIRYCEDSLALAQTLGLTLQVIDSFHGLATAQTALEEYSQAAIYLRKARELSKKIGTFEPHLENCIRWSEFLIARISQRSEKDTEEKIERWQKLAQKKLARAQHLAVNHRDRRRIWEIVFLQGKLLTLQGDRREGEKRLHRALHLSKKFARCIPEEYRHYFQDSNKLRQLRQMLTFLKAKPSKAGAAADQTQSNNLHPLPEPFSKRELRKYLGLVHQLAFLDSAERDKWFDAVLELVLEIGNATRVILLTRQGETFAPNKTRFAPSATEKRSVFREDFVQMVTEMGVALHSGSAPEDPNLQQAIPHETLHELKTLNLSCLPIRSGKVTLGVLYVDRYARKKTSGESPRENQGALDMMASLLSLGLSKFAP